MTDAQSDVFEELGLGAGAAGVDVSDFPSLFEAAVLSEVAGVDPPLFSAATAFLRDSEG
jgi:hypothetical protein